MKKILGLILILAIFWIVNSGYFKPLLLSLGAASVLAVVYFVQKLEKLDGESYPLFMPLLRLPAYLLWMLWQIILTNLDVVKYIIKGKSAISPVLFEIRADQKTETGKALYANSITLTPGTVTMNIKGNIFVVHALTQAAADDLKKGEMNRRVNRLEG